MLKLFLEQYQPDWLRIAIVMIAGSVTRQQENHCVNLNHIQYTISSLENNE